MYDRIDFMGYKKTRKPQKTTNPMRALNCYPLKALYNGVQYSSGFVYKSLQRNLSRNNDPLRNSPKLAFYSYVEIDKLVIS